ncbi:NAC domain-containing protein 17 [Raphanus sativus]|nr:NAC domain-containing protein 17 [Raphanus sativus]
MADSCLKGGKFSAPGFRFHPTDEELVMYYLKRKICKRKLRVNAIGVVDVYKFDPEELPGQSVLKTGDRQWFYFTPRSRKYPNAARGRAPTGQRTDWVMHEYTMDEDELGRCKNAKEYYALYKLFKKSGAGPKNGEEYGAPFQEEEWVDEEEEPVLDDLEEILSGIPFAPGVPQTCTNIPQVNREEDLQSTSNNSVMEPLVFEKDDYIEMDDLLTPDLGASLSLVEKNPAQLLNPGEYYGDFNDFDQLFHDVSMSLDMEPILQETSADLLSNFADNTSDQEQQLLYQQFQDQTSENKLNNIMDPTPNLNQFTDDLWLEDDNQTAVLFDQPQSVICGAFASPSSGVIPASTNLATSVDDAQDQEGVNGGGGTSPFSSALWAFMDSIPSTPASACEGPINRTFVRMSSFSRIRFSGKANGTPVNTAVIAKKRGINRGFLLLSIVGALCAIFWVLVPTVQTSGRPVFS